MKGVNLFYLFSYTDVTAASNVGRILARRCLEAGLTHVFYDRDTNEKSNKVDINLYIMKDMSLHCAINAEKAKSLTEQKVSDVRAEIKVLFFR